MSSNIPERPAATRRTTSGRASRSDGRSWRPSASPTSPSSSSATSPRSSCPRRARPLKQAEVFGTVESVKAVSDLFAPVAARSSRSTRRSPTRPRRQRGSLRRGLDDPGRASANAKELDRPDGRRRLPGVPARAGGVVNSTAWPVDPRHSHRPFPRSPHRPGRRRGRARCCGRSARLARRADRRDRARRTSACARRSICPPAAGEHELLAELQALAAQEPGLRSFIGMGYYDCITPPVIQRNILENPGWYTAVHALPGGDRAGPARGAAELPDDGRAT